MKDLIRATLCAHYGLHADTVQAVPGGWSALAYTVGTARGDYFVKVYDRQRVSTLPWLDRMDAYMPAVLWLHGSTPLGRRMTAPLRAADGSYRVAEGDYTILVYPCINGVTLCETPLDAEQVRQLAAILAGLHAHGAEVPAPTEGLREDFALPFMEGLATILRGDYACEALRGALAPYTAQIGEAMAALQGLADALRRDPPRQVLCHTDVHGWNLMWAEHLYLIDWEGLRLAPVEADLFSFADGFFFDYAQDAFMAAYREARGGYQVDATAMAFYRLRRRLEDIAAFADSVLNDPLSAEEVAGSLVYMKKECEMLARDGKAARRTHDRF